MMLGLPPPQSDTGEESPEGRRGNSNFPRDVQLILERDKTLTKTRRRGLNSAPMSEESSPFLYIVVARRLFWAGFSETNDLKLYP